jgi:small subunit ribosomal protein S21
MNKRKYKEKEEANMALKVEARKGEDVENLLRRFKRKLKKEDRIIEIRKWDYYQKPSDKKRAKRRRKKFSDGRDF